MQRLLCHAFILLLLAFTSCSKNDLKQNDLDLRLQNAKALYEKLNAPQVRGEKISDGKHYLEKRVDWDHAFVQNLKFGSTLVVPFEVKDGALFATSDNGKHRVAVNNYSYLIFYRSKGEPICEVVYQLPRAYSDTSKTKGNSKFSGSIRVEAVNGDVLKSFVYDKGKARAVNTVFSQKQQARTEDFTCITTEYYYCVTYKNFRDCHFNFSTTECYSDGGGVQAPNPIKDPSNPDVGNGGGTGGGDGGGNGGYEEIARVEVETDYRDTCPENFYFVSATTHDLWQEAAISDIRLNCIYTNTWTRQTIIRSLNIPILYFGAPWHDKYGLQIFSRIQAQNIFAYALNDAEAIVRSTFRENPTLTEGELEELWISKMQQFVAGYLPAARIGRTGSTNSKVPIPPVPFDPSNCGR